MSGIIDQTVIIAIIASLIILIISEFTMRILLTKRARYISTPLEIMAKMADDILGNASKKNIFKGINVAALTQHDVVENDEIGHLASEFVKMIAGNEKGRRKSVGDGRGIQDTKFVENPITEGGKSFDLKNGLPWKG